jgi:ATP-dependent Clp protease protease subunit
MPEEQPASEPTPSNPSRVPSRIVEELLAARTVLVFGEIDSRLAHSVGAQLLSLAELGSDPIRVVVNSPGGHVEAGDTIHDLLRFITPEIVMIGTGWVASAAALVYVAAPRENRFCLPNTRFLLHQPLGGVRGPASDIDIEAAQILSIRDRIGRILARETGQTLERIAKDTERNHWMNAEQAVEYGLVGAIVERQDHLPPAARILRRNRHDR